MYKYYATYAPVQRRIFKFLLLLIDPAWNPTKIRLKKAFSTNFRIIFIFLSLLSTRSFGQTGNITIVKKNISLEKAFHLLKKQTDYDFVYSRNQLAKTSLVNIAAKNATIIEVLDQCFIGQPISYQIQDKIITIKGKQSIDSSRHPETTTGNIVSGNIFDENNKPLVAVSIVEKNNQTMTRSDRNGAFKIFTSGSNTVLVLSHIGYTTKEINAQEALRPIIMSPSAGNLQEVNIVSTGYQTLDREKTAGSFVQIDNKLLNRTTSTNVIDRLRDVVPGLYFQDKDISLARVQRNPNFKTSGITIRGESTFLASKEPLIILNNFPYEGDIKNINPNDIESITVLKDASAASIWGTRSGNGVIVITTKKGKRNQKIKIDFNNNISIISKPDLFSSEKFLPSKSYMEVEQFLFDKGYFDAQLNDVTSFPVVSPAVELFNKYKQATTDQVRSSIQDKLDILGSNDVRNDFKKYVYQAAVNQQYSIGIRGGSENSAYTLSIGHDQNKDNLIRNGYHRTTVNSLVSYEPLKNFEISLGINYSRNTTLQNNTFGFGIYNQIGFPYFDLYPYANLVDEDGSQAAISRGLRNSYLMETQSKGFLDWNYRPLEEISLSDNSTKVNNLLFNLGATYKITENLRLAINYQNERETILDRNYQNVNTFYARNLINQFAVFNAANSTYTYPFPRGGIMNLGSAEWIQNNLRAQFNYSSNINQHHFNIAGGGEAKQLQTELYTKIAYGYNDQFGSSISNLNYGTFYPINPVGTAIIPAPGEGVGGILTRNLSYFALANYDYNNRFTVNLSARIDGANLYGARTNDKFSPLWSVGLGWNISSETFYNFELLENLRLRATYGYQGNTSNTSGFLSGSYSTSTDTGSPYLNISTAPNPRLRWETTRTVNLGLDFSTKGGIISGTIDAFHKAGNDLIQPTPIATQTGFTSFLTNLASLNTKGLDFSIRSRNLRGPFQWETNAFLSRVTDKVIKYSSKVDAVTIPGSGSATGSSLVAGWASYSIFSYKWAGLNPENGNPRGYLNGQISEDYTGIMNNFNIDSVAYSGSARPTTFGAIRNDISYKNLTLSVNISYKLGYVFRKQTTSLNYTSILQSGQHLDYQRRWQKPGDERSTTVPSLVYPDNENRNTFYQLSEALILHGDHIRLQDIRLSYMVPESLLGKNSVRTLSFFSTFSNLGILWRKNKFGIDPSAVGSGTVVVPAAFSLSFGINANF